MVHRVNTIVYRTVVRGSRDTLYLFGDNTLRSGFGGQAKEMRGEPNAHGIITKIFPNNEPGSFMRDESYKQNCVLISIDISCALAKYVNGGYKHLVIPPMGIGLAKLPVNAPKTFKFLTAQLLWLEDTINTFNQQQ